MRPERTAVDPDPLADLFWSVAGRLRVLGRATLAPWDISPSHARALGVLLRQGDLRLSELSDHLHIAPRSATEVVDALQERGLAERHPDPHDRRATLVGLTAAGREAGESIRAARAAEAQAFFGVLDDDDRAALTRILTHLQTPPGSPTPS